MMTDSAPLLFAGFLTALCLLCVSIALIDIRHGIIPNGLNLTIGGLGLVKAVVDGGAMTGVEAAVQAILVGALFWLFRRLYFVLRNVQGLGLGDVKFLVAAATWVGLAGIPMLILVAAIAALVAAGAAQLAGQKLTRQTSLPFGPFLALGLLSAVVAQDWFGLL